jgi:hypothetical protein
MPRGVRLRLLRLATPFQLGGMMKLRFSALNVVGAGIAPILKAFGKNLIPVDTENL